MKRLPPSRGGRYPANVGSVVDAIKADHLELAKDVLANPEKCPPGSIMEIWAKSILEQHEPNKGE